MKNKLFYTKWPCFIYALSFLCIICTNILHGQSQDQQFQVNGVITDELGALLPGANIIEKGFTNGVSSDFDGIFFIKVSNVNASITVC
jgi:hypothetical protein